MREIEGRKEKRKRKRRRKGKSKGRRKKEIGVGATRLVERCTLRNEIIFPLECTQWNSTVTLVPEKGDCTLNRVHVLPLCRAWSTGISTSQKRDLQRVHEKRYYTREMPRVGSLLSPSTDLPSLSFSTFLLSFSFISLFNAFASNFAGFVWEKIAQLAL